MNDAQLVDAVARLATVKAKEAQLKEERAAIETEIIDLTGFAKPEGQQGFKAEDGDASCEVILKQPITTSVDAEAWEEIRKTLPTKHPGREVFLRAYKLETKKARALQADSPIQWAEVSDAITRKPGKVSVTVKSIQRGIEPERGGES